MRSIVLSADVAPARLRPTDTNANNAGPFVAVLLTLSDISTQSILTIDGNVPAAQIYFRARMRSHATSKGGNAVEKAGYKSRAAEM
jgi:hypothetical protein